MLVTWVVVQLIFGHVGQQLVCGDCMHIWWVVWSWFYVILFFLLIVHEHGIFFHFQVCRRAGDSTKFKFCKRCDGAVHCYCMQPPHKVILGRYSFDFLCFGRHLPYVHLDVAECQFWALLMLQAYKVPQLWVKCSRKWSECKVPIDLLAT